MKTVFLMGGATGLLVMLGTFVIVMVNYAYVVVRRRKGLLGSDYKWWEMRRRLSVKQNQVKAIEAKPPAENFTDQAVTKLERTPRD